MINTINLRVHIANAELLYNHIYEKQTFQKNYFNENDYSHNSTAWLSISPSNTISLASQQYFFVL